MTLSPPQEDPPSKRSWRGLGGSLPPWGVALGVTCLMQMASSFLLQGVPVLGPTLTDAADVSPEFIGHLSALNAFGSIWFLMGGGALLASMGPIRLLQFGALVSGAAILLVMTGSWPMMALSALVMGLGYGPSPPAASELLMRHSPPRHRSLIFSAKQAGAPLGAAVAALLLPFLAVNEGWRLALLTTAVIACLPVLLVEPFRASMEVRSGRLRLAPFFDLLSPRMLLTPFRALTGSPALPRLAYVGFAMANVQGSVFALYVTFLTTDLGFDLTAAGSAFAVMLMTGAVARLIVGYASDRLGSPVLTLILLGTGGSAMMGVLALMQAGWPWWAIILVSIATGFLAASWNGVLLAEVARVSVKGRVGDTTSSATFFTFIGYIVGPAAFATLVHESGSYPLAFLCVAVLPLTAVALLIVAPPAADAYDRGVD